MHLLYKFLLLISISFTLSACNISPSSSPPSSSNINPNISQNPISLNQVLQGHQLLAYLSFDDLQIVDPDFAQPATVTQLEPEQLPTSSQLFDFQVSRTNRWIVWYAPPTGILKLNTKDLKTSNIEPNSDWLNSNPYFEYSSDSQYLYYISHQGKTFNKYHLDNEQKSTFTIPYPFGSEFRVSPDNQKILYISGFNQQAQTTTFMFTDNYGQSSHQFETQTELADRYLVEWTPDSSGVIMVQGSQLVLYPYPSANQTEIIYTAPQGRIIDFDTIDDLIYVLSDSGYWYIYSYSLNKKIGQTPISIASELTKPKFYPWENKTFLIVETKPGLDYQYQRLWLSNFTGSKKLIIPKFNQVKPAPGNITL